MEPLLLAVIATTLIMLPFVVVAVRRDRRRRAMTDDDADPTPHRPGVDSRAVSGMFNIWRNGGGVG